MKGQRHNMGERNFISCDQKSNVHVMIWKPDKALYPKPIAILQIAHGMVEYIERYADFAHFLTQAGILVVGNDHLGHGHTASCDEDLGYFRHENPENALVHDMHHLTNIIKAKYPNVPYFLLGHSMGSFMTRKYISIYGDELDGVILSGTGNQAKPLISFALTLTNIIGLFKGERHRSQLLANAMMSSYNNKIKNPKTPSDWISRDEEIVDRYVHDKYCTFLFTINAYKGMFRTIKYISKQHNIDKIPADLPMLMASGTMDPVGGYAKDVKKLYQRYSKRINNITLKLYEGDRHEILNELDRETVYQDILNWILVQLGK
ncbi:alpha/beta fold hydrolase [Lachnospira multipara]|uniref:alpha/beta fold hydrolase n=1 Tax=Lachnospira multipara TaxID=28051 RepID=UPI0009DC3759|nr:alpha/beta fold hydrolase [Lachnospira multipara]